MELIGLSSDIVTICASARKISGAIDTRMSTLAVYIVAAVAEIAGCFAFWAWLRLEKSVFWLLPGVASLAAFAWLLTLSPAGYAGRAYAVYGGVYIACSLAWLWIAEGFRPDRWDLIGAAVCLTGAAIILWMPRTAENFP
jgi:small multidrug resistance family-3 protein